MREKITLSYPEIGPQKDYLLIEEICDDLELYRMAPAMLDLRVEAFSRQLENTQQLLPKGTINELYTPEKRENLQRMRKNIDRVLTSEKGRFYIARDTDRPAKIEGLIQVREDYRGDCILDELVVRQERRGTGSGLLHAALTLMRIETLPRRPLARLESVKGSTVNDWYISLGFQASESSTPWQIGEFTLPIEKYVTHESVAINGVLAELEARTPALTRKIVKYTEKEA
jgi:hypothetical protein